MEIPLVKDFIYQIQKAKQYKETLSPHQKSHTVIYSHYNR